MSQTILVLFWVFWLLDVMAALLGYREFMGSVFGHYATASSKYITLWVFLLTAILLVLGGSLYFKNHGQSSVAIIIAAVPLVLALPYALFLAGVMLAGKNKWN